MNKFFHIITQPIKWLFLIPIYIYKVTLSKIMPDVCIYQSTCSTYTITAIKKFGVIKGILMGTKRIFRCTPRHEGGLDPVPDNIRSDIKYII